MKTFNNTMTRTMTRAILLTAGLLAGMSTSALADTQTSAQSQVKAIRDIAPEYPASALRREVSGYVVVRFDVDDNGRARNIEVVEANPQRLFDSSVLSAVRKSTFEIPEGGSSAGVERIYRFGPAENNEQNQFSMYNAFHQ